MKRFTSKELIICRSTTLTEIQSIANKRDKFVAEPRLLDPVLRGIYISEHDSFESLIDNPYVQYCPPTRDVIVQELQTLQDDESYEGNILEHSMQETPTGSRGGENTLQNYISLNLEQGSDYNYGAAKISIKGSALMEPLLESKDEEQLEEMKSKSKVSKANKDSTRSSYIASEAKHHLDRSYCESENPEEILNNGLSPTSQQIER